MAVIYKCDRCGQLGRIHGCHVVSKVQMIEAREGTCKISLDEVDLCRTCLDSVISQMGVLLSSEKASVVLGE